ncbi:MAG: accessory factor UbiK family protein [Pseudomonadota bacterium]
MSKSNKIIEDITQLAGSAAGLMHDLKTQMHDDVKARVEEIADKMDLVPREDFEKLEAQVADLTERLKQLEDK